MIYHLLKFFKVQYVVKGRWVYKSSDCLSSFFVILNGRVQVSNVDESQTVVAERGECLGSSLLFTKYSEGNIRG